jgi:signal transduction histidine kinase
MLALLAVTESLVRSAVEGKSAQLTLVLCLMAASTTLPFALLGRAGAAIAISAASLLSLALFHTLTVAGVAAQLLTLYRFGHDGSPLLAVGLAAEFLVLALVGPYPAGSEAGTLTILLVALAPAAALGGFARHARSEALMQNASRRAVAGDLLEHAARGERARIARELHDVVAHHISMVTVQAEAARLTTPELPAAGAQRLSAIGDTARAALTEMRRLLDVLSEDAETDTAERRPQPGLKQLTELVDETRAASATGTRLILRGSPVTLDPGVELAAYRIVQESLTNVRRHAPGAGVDVELHYNGDSLRVRIRDNGPGPPVGAPVGSHGLSGMRERATAVGGELRTGLAAGGGFLVQATLPAHAEASE